MNINLVIYSKLLEKKYGCNINSIYNTHSMFIKIFFQYVLLNFICRIEKIISLSSISIVYVHIWEDSVTFWLMWANNKSKTYKFHFLPEVTLKPQTCCIKWKKRRTPFTSDRREKKEKKNCIYKFTPAELFKKEAVVFFLYRSPRKKKTLPIVSF